MSELFDDVKEYASVTRRYIDVKIEVTKARAKIIISEVISTMVIGVIVAILVGGALVILSFGLAETIGERMENKAMGFYIVGIGYLVVGAIVFILGKAFFKRYIQNEILRKLVDES
jgi:hypothetical protein